jgi:hypothetical protein
LALFSRLISHLFQLVFSAGTVFFSKKISRNSVLACFFNEANGAIVNLVNPSFITEALVWEDLVGQELIGSDLFAQICTKRALIKLDTES